MKFWHHGMPWAAVNAALDDSDFYDPGPEAETNFARTTGGCDWSNVRDDLNLAISCPTCAWTWSNVAEWTSQQYSSEIAPPSNVPWTTVGSSLIAHTQWFKDLANGTDEDRDTLLRSIGSTIEDGKGYADASFAVECKRCHGRTDHDALRANKFARDLIGFYRTRSVRGDPVFDADKVANVSPMPGTVLASNGQPELADKYAGMQRDCRLFPNRICDAILNQRGFSSTRPPLRFTMEAMKGLVEDSIRDYDTLAYAQGIKTEPGRRRARFRLAREERMSIRKMFSRYWDNSSPFALDLIGAVVRQGSFIEKMVKLDWLHSPTVSATASRVLEKYFRFMTILGNDPSKMAVPTLDVDLAWHTHQLAPAVYFKYSVAKTKDTFIDHDDKVAETVLSDAFARTSEQYERLFGEPYSQCTCWYCEAIRASHTSSAARLLRRSSISQVTAQLHDAPSDPDCSAHISAHSAIQPRMYRDVYRTNAQAQFEKLRAAYDKACKRARKDGRPEPKLPPHMQTGKREGKRDDRRDDDGMYMYAYGYGYYGVMPYYGYGYAPYMCDPGVTGGAYAATPACASMDPGSYGACCQGSCGGTVAAGSCGGSGVGGCVGGSSGGCAGAGGCGSGGGAGVGGCGGGGGGDGGGGGGGCGGGGGGCGGGG